MGNVRENIVINWSSSIVLVAKLKLNFRNILVSEVQAVFNRDGIQWQAYCEPVLKSQDSEILTQFLWYQ